MIRLTQIEFSEKTCSRVLDVLKSGALVQGKMVEEAEHMLAEYLNVPETVLVSSGTAALHLACCAIGLKSGDEVIVPAFTFPATANAVELTGAKAVFADINLQDCCINPAKIEACITPQTRAIMIVHEFGQTADIKPILEIAKRHDLRIIEDAACALGSAYNRQKCGTIGDIGCFSLHPRKAITSGEGGLIVSHDHALTKRFRILRNHGIIHSETGMDFVEAGFNYRMTDFQAALLPDQLADFENNLNKRRTLANCYNIELQNTGLLLPLDKPGCRMTYQTYHVILPAGTDRKKIIDTMKEAGIEVNLGAQCLPALHYFKEKYKLNPMKYPNSFTAYTCGLALPIGNHLTCDTVCHIAQVLKETLTSTGVMRK